MSDPELLHRVRDFEISVGYELAADGRNEDSDLIFVRGPDGAAYSSSNRHLGG